MNLEKILNKTKKIAKRVITTALAGSLFLSSCKKPEIVPITLPTSNTEKVIILPKGILDNLTSYNYNNGEVIFLNSVDYSVGDIIVAGISNKTPDGFLRQITSISSDKKKIQSTQATIEQAVEEGYLEYQEQLTPFSKNKSGTIKSMDGVDLIKGSAFDFNYQLTNVVLYDVDGNLSTTNDQILANGFINFNNSLDIKLNIANRKLDYFLFQNTVTENSQIKITSNTSLSIDKEKTIWSKKFGAITIGYIPTPVGPLPVVVTPQLDVNVGVTGNVLVNIATDVTQTASLTGGVSYNNSQWNDLKNFTNSFNFNPPQVSGNLNFRGFAGPKLDLLLYGVAGPYAGANAFLRLNASGSPNLSWTLYGGLEVIAGAKIEALSKTWVDYNATVISNEKILAQGGATLNTIIIQPGPTDGKDAGIHKTVWPDCSETYSGFGNDSLITVWYEYGQSVCNGSEDESLLEFPLSQLPVNSNIVSAKLKLFDKGVSCNYINYNPVFKLWKITSSWNESSVKWDTKPQGVFISNTELDDLTGVMWREFDATSLVQNWINGDPNYGLLISVNSSYCDDVMFKFFSSEHSDASKRPKLEISYY